MERQRIALVVDDQKLIRDLASQILGTQGYHVVTACSGNEATTKLCAISPTAIFLDVNMPNEDGYQLCRRIRSEFPHLNCPIIFVTTNRSPEDVREALAVGGDYFVIKPFNENSLLIGLKKAFLARSRKPKKPF